MGGGWVRIGDTALGLNRHEDVGADGGVTVLLVVLGWLVSAAVLVYASSRAGYGTDPLSFDDVMLRGVMVVSAPVLIVLASVLAALWLLGATFGWAVDRLSRR